MAELSWSEAKFSLENTLLSLLGRGASGFIDSVNDAVDKPGLSTVVLSIISTLERGSHAEAAKALSHQWIKIRNRI